jgi:hypothetical protein
MIKIAEFGFESGSGSISQMNGSADPDPDPDPHQNVMDLQHCCTLYRVVPHRGKGNSCIKTQF